MHGIYSYAMYILLSVRSAPCLGVRQWTMSRLESLPLLRSTCLAGVKGYIFIVYRGKVIRGPDTAPASLR